MAFSHQGMSITRKSSGDTSSYQYHLMIIAATNDDDGCILSTGIAQTPVGVWQNNSTAAEYGDLVVLGVSKVVSETSDTAISVGSWLITDDSVAGHATLSTAGTVNPNIVGYALEAVTTGVSGQIISMMVIPSGPSTST